VPSIISVLIFEFMTNFSRMTRVLFIIHSRVFVIIALTWKYISITPPPPPLSVFFMPHNSKISNGLPYRFDISSVLT
jgi:hypothetical protein